MSMTLYEIAPQYRQLADKLQDMGLDEQAINDTLEAETDLIPKVQAYGMVIRNLESYAEAVDQEAKRLAEKAGAAKKRIDRIKSQLLHGMQTAGVQKVEHPQFTIGIQANPDAVQIDGEDLIPSDYMREVPATYSPDKTLIKKALKDGFTVPGASLRKSVRLVIK